MSTQRWSKLRKFARPLLVGAVVVLSQLDWRVVLALSVAVVIMLGLPVITGYWMARDTDVARYWSPVQRWSRDPGNEE